MNHREESDCHQDAKKGGCTEDVSNDGCLMSVHSTESTRTVIPSPPCSTSINAKTGKIASYENVTALATKRQLMRLESTHVHKS
jgi:hypothetical protein